VTRPLSLARGPEADAVRSRPLGVSPWATLAQVVERIRTANGWTQEEMAAKCGVDRARVADWERSKSIPGAALLETLVALAAGTEAALTLPTLVWLWWREQAADEEVRALRARRKGRAA
jgi:transcriptional regulator with XRE-family HTH domain